MNSNDIIEFFRSRGVSLVQALVVLILGIILIKLLNKLLKKIFFKSIVDNSITTFIISILNIILYIVLVYIVFMLIGISTTGFVAAISACALAVGLALQDTLKNLASGLLIVLTKPFIQGDLVEVGVVKGKIRQIRLINTSLVTLDNKMVTIPNSKFINGEVINYTKRKNRRIELIVPVAYGSNLASVKEIINQVVDENEYVMHNIKSTVRLYKYNESSLDFIIWCWCYTENYWDAYFDILENIYTEFENKNISIPFNQMDVHIMDSDKKMEADRTSTPSTTMNTEYDKELVRGKKSSMQRNMNIENDKALIKEKKSSRSKS